MQQFSNNFEPTFSNLLDLEFRLKPEILEQIWKLLFEEKLAKMYFAANTSDSSFWIRNLRFPYSRHPVTINKILYSFTFKEATFFLWDVEHIGKDLMFHYVRLYPNEPRKQFLLGSKATREIFYSQVYDLRTGRFKYGLWKNQIELNRLSEKCEKGFMISPKNREKLINLMNRKSINQRKNLCVVI
jgi:hypothetical protein